MSPRADALRNRARVLAAADEVFVEHGSTASTEEVARRAGVGVGTVFRHFPTKEALRDAVYAERLRRVGEEASRLADNTDAGAAFHEFFELLAGTSGPNQALTEALAASATDDQDVRGSLGVLLDRAQRAGAVRSDVGVDEVIALLIGATQATTWTADVSLRGRTLNIILDGLRPH
ncbi:TetR/AcrR family transcriptional regulator [Prauserella cavernicola]|uniref:Helix-turn-helix transcriptional regulator n=1 Tax=Prauserella cavernicola TaxID=2800127 RepID=A0A934QSD9_9PSEU|nr:helix-turn-helix domain-containing protein [Prauserella cavernicola]MBK1785356.1 helix-turn-helix transcriptional regulator [Prauserella cavernicola]